MNQNHSENAFDRPLPGRIDIERLVLGAAMTDPDAFPQTADLLTANDFSLETNRRIFLCTSEIYARGEEINYLSVVNELIRKQQLESVDGLSYVVSLSDGMPHIVDLARYCEIVRAAAIKRQAIHRMKALIQRCYDPGEDTLDLLGDVERVTELLNSSDRRNSVARARLKTWLQTQAASTCFLRRKKTRGSTFHSPKWA